MSHLKKMYLQFIIVFTRQLDCCGVVNIKTDLGASTSNPWVAGLTPGVHVPKTCCTGVDATNYNSNPNPGPCTSGTSGYNTKVSDIFK